MSTALKMFPGLPGFYYSPALAWPVCVRTLNNGDCQKQPLSKCVSHTYTKYTNKRSRQFGCWESKYPPPPLLLYNYLSHFYYLHWKYWKSGSICWTRLIIAGVKRRFRTSLACKKVSIHSLKWQHVDDNLLIFKKLKPTLYRSVKYRQWFALRG